MQTKMYIAGLPENCRRGDVLGAVVNEAGVDADAVGDIDISGSIATVETAAGAKAAVVDRLEQVAGNEVMVAGADHPRCRFLRLALLVEAERQEEMKRHEQEIKQMSGPRREREGRALLHLTGGDEGTGLGGKHLVKLSRQRPGEPLPETEIGVGDLVVISKEDPLRDDNPAGTVAQKTNYSVTVAFDKKPPRFIYGKDLRCDLHVNDITYQRQLTALMRAFTAAGSRLSQLADRVLGVDDIEPASRPADAVTFIDEKLNRSQKEAVRGALAAGDFFLIHGPPGTGKTVTCVEIARQLIRRGENVLCAADSNTAVDNLVQWFAEAGERVVRVGHPARVTPLLREHTLDHMVTENEKYKRSQQLRRKVEALLDEQEKATHPGGRWRRGMSDQMIRSLAKKGKGSRGVPPAKIREMAAWLRLQEQIDELFSQIHRLQQQAVEEILQWADVVCATNSGCGSELLAGYRFDTAVIDEATQATEPSCWIPMSLCGRVVMAGDHKQLPPTILSHKAQDLNKTLFEYMLQEFDDCLRGMLRVQYRMHRDIMSFVDREFYQGALRADQSVAEHTLADLVGEVDAQKQDPIGEALDPRQPVVFLDTTNIPADDKTRKGSTSKENPREAEIAVSLAVRLQKLGLQQQDIAVITPYHDQVDLIDRRLQQQDLEVDTVDGFQGREKEAVILSLVRSNPRQNIGFLEDVRRLNVSLTRAKRKLIIIGDSSTINAHPTYERLLEYVAGRGRLLSLG